MMKLVIDRRRWIHGEGGDSSRLLRLDDKKMCCLGFLSLACGASENDIGDFSEPNEMDIRPTHEVFQKLLLQLEGEDCDHKYTYYNPSTIAIDMMVTNDSKALSESEREEKLTGYFKEIGVEVEFIN
jgi:hypothetical protein